jgi:hypothetical protein
VELKDRLRLAGNVARVGEIINAYKILFGKSERKKPLIIDSRIISKCILTGFEVSD